MKGLTKTKKFIEENGLDFTGSRSELNGNCVILAGFICYVLELNDMIRTDGEALIKRLPISITAQSYLEDIFTYVWYKEYEEFWKTAEAKEKYIF